MKQTNDLREQARSQILTEFNCQHRNALLFCGSWLACDGINLVYLKHRGACIAGKPAPTEKPSTAVVAAKLGQNCGSGLARECGGSVTHELTDTPYSRASPLPQLDLSTSGGSCSAVLLPCFCFNHSGRLLGRRAVDFDLDLTGPVNHDGRTQA